MAKSPTVRATAPDTVWLARGRFVGPGAEEVVRRRLREQKNDRVIQDHLELDDTRDGAGRRVFEARWQVSGAVTVRARLTVETVQGSTDERTWSLAAEAERPWDLEMPSPAAMFWPEDTDVPWDHDLVPGLRLRTINPLPGEDKELRRLLNTAAHNTWSIHVVVHEAMTTDERGRRPLARLMPPSLRHRIVEHRAAPDQFQIVNWALRDLGVQVPRGGAVVLPGTPPRPGYEDDDFTVRSVFLDGSVPTDLIDTVTRYAALPRPLVEDAATAVSDLREQWHLLTVEEELAHARALVATYAEALEAMTKSRDLYREAAELAHEALAALQESGAGVPVVGKPRRPEGLPFRGLAKTLERLKDTAGSLRLPGAGAASPGTRTEEPDARADDRRDDVPCS
jgi:hypothetical protein